MLESARKCSKVLENARKCSKMLESARKLLEIFTAWLGSTRIFLENELLENAWLEFYFPCLKSPNKY